MLTLLPHLPALFSSTSLHTKIDPTTPTPNLHRRKINHRRSEIPNLSHTARRRSLLIPHAGHLISLRSDLSDCSERPVISRIPSRVLSPPLRHLRRIVASTHLFCIRRLVCLTLIGGKGSYTVSRQTSLLRGSLPLPCQERNYKSPVLTPDLREGSRSPSPPDNIVRDIPSVGLGSARVTQRRWLSTYWDFVPIHWFGFDYNILHLSDRSSDHQSFAVEALPLRGTGSARLQYITRTHHIHIEA